MAYFATENLEIKMSPGSGNSIITSPTESNIEICGEGVYAGIITFTSSCSSWPGLTGCSGGGSITGTCSNIKLNGKNTVLSTDVGQCNGIGVNPQGIPMPCSCVCKIKESSNVTSVVI